MYITYIYIHMCTSMYVKHHKQTTRDSEIISSTIYIYILDKL